MTPSGIETATFRLVAQCLKPLRQHVPRISPVSLRMLRGIRTVLTQVYAEIPYTSRQATR